MAADGFSWSHLSARWMAHQLGRCWNWTRRQARRECTQHLRWMVLAGFRQAVRQTGLTTCGLRYVRHNKQCEASLASSRAVVRQDMRLGLLKVAPDGAVTQVSRVCDGGVMQGCNDCAFDSKGNLFVTAPAGPIAPAAYTRSMQEPFGSVYCFPAVAESTVSGEFAQVPVHRIATGYRFPNGLAVTKDDATLIVAETPTKSLWAFDILSPSHVRNRRLWARLPGDHDGGPDGMDFDDAGNLLVANWGGSHIEVYNPAGTQIARIKCPFANPDRKSVV